MALFASDIATLRLLYGPGFRVCSRGWKIGSTCRGVLKPGLAAQVSRCVLGGSCVVISRVICRVAILTTHIKGRITLVITTPEPQVFWAQRSQKMDDC